MAVKIMIDLAGAIFRQFLEGLRGERLSVVKNHFPDRTLIRLPWRPAREKVALKYLAGVAGGIQALLKSFGFQRRFQSGRNFDVQLQSATPSPSSVAVLAKLKAHILKVEPGGTKESFKFWDPDGFLVQLNAPGYEGQWGK